MPDKVGQQIGNYRLVKLLGRGGFAEVYLGEHLRLKTQAAIKVLHTSLEDDDVEGFLREAQTVARLKHPHIVRVFDFDVENHTPFLVMDYLPNGNIRRSHPKSIPLPLPTIVSYVTQVASALQYAHDEKLIHRDIKPENMLLDKGDTVVLSDFGIAMMAQSSRYQSTQEIAGTAAYMAPEQFQGKPRRACDQYALGVVVYEWLTGDRPFHGSFSEIASQHLLVPPPSLREKVSTVSLDVEQVVLTALAEDADNRYRSVKAFAIALEQASQSAQSRSSAFSQAPTVASRPLQPLTVTSPAMPLSQQTVTSSPVEGVHTLPAPLDQSGQVVGSSRLYDRPEPVRQGISRRAMLLGLGVAGLAVAGGSLTWLLSSQGKHPFPLGTLLYTYRGHSSFVSAVAWSPDGIRIASGSGDFVNRVAQDTIVQVWDAIDGGYVYSYRGHSLPVNAVAWSPDGTRIASGSQDTTVQVWDATTGSNVYTYRGHTDGVGALARSLDGTRIASSGDKTVQVWEAV